MSGVRRAACCVWYVDRFCCLFTRGPGQADTDSILFSMCHVLQPSPSVPAYPQITADTLTLLYTVYNTHVYVVVSRLPGPASALRSHTIITTQLRSYHHILFTTGTSERGSARADKFVRLRHGSGVSGHPSTHHLVDTRRFHARPRAI